MAQDSRCQSAGLLAAESVPALCQDLPDLGQALAGGIKATQPKDIKRAQALAAEIE